jgi:hypothetical protein
MTFVVMQQESLTAPVRNFWLICFVVAAHHAITAPTNAAAVG